MRNHPTRRVLSICGICRKWKVHKAFVQSYVWKKFKTCNKCTRIYRYKSMSADEKRAPSTTTIGSLKEPWIILDILNLIKHSVFKDMEQVSRLERRRNSYHYTKDTPRSPSSNLLAGAKKTPSGRSRNTSGQLAQGEKTLHPDLKVKVDNVKIGQIEAVATEYNALLAAKDCLIHGLEHAGQSLSQWKVILGNDALDFPLMAQDCLCHIQSQIEVYKTEDVKTEEDADPGAIEDMGIQRVIQKGLVVGQILQSCSYPISAPIVIFHVVQMKIASAMT